MGKLKLYNSLTRKVEPFEPSGPVTIYTCGPTVYGPGHLGHGRSYTNFDLIKRTLLYLGYEVKHVLNITDIHDDMITKADEEGITIFELADRYIPLFHRDLVSLNILKADYYPRVTEVIPEIIAMVETLVEKGYAYVEDDGSVYYDVSEFDDYGKLSGNRPEAGKTGTRVETDKYEREEVVDFVLWKGHKEGEPFWESPWGKGRPGWHIECSVMAKKYLGDTIDIHAGALDLRFPHHENEIAQSEAATGEQFARFWVHGGLLQIEGRKMSKSLGNYTEIAEVIEEGVDPIALRYLFLTAHYRSELNFTREGLEAAGRALDRLRSFVRYWKSLEGEQASVDGVDEDYRGRFMEALGDDVDVPRALSLLWELVKDETVNESTKYATALEFDRVLGLDLPELEAVEVPEEVRELVERRERLRAQERWDAADRARERVRELGFEIEDTAAGPTVVPMTS